MAALTVTRRPMSDRVILHIGVMKTGTSFLQSVLQYHTQDLAAEGVDFLGSRFGKQARAVLDGLKLPQQPRRNTRRWRRLVSDAHEGRTGVVSMEFLSYANPSQVESFLSPLRGRDVRVVLTVRDQLRAVPAQWQSYARNRGTASWNDYLRDIQSRRTGGRRRTRASRTFHRAQDIETIVHRWGARPEVNGLTIVTVPPPGAPRDELWQRFCAASGLPPLDLPPEGIKENQSLGYASCELLRLLNPLVADVRPPRYRRVVRRVSRDALAPLRESESRPVLDRAGAEFARSRNRRLRRFIEGGGQAFIGDL